MIRIFAVLNLLALAACGADGEPVTPSMNTTVSITSSGVVTSTGVTVRKGPVTLGMSL
ncbi:hypothetical protein RXV86_01945 [Alisedimentitalea sp. MJ-SS2]|uniref:hypothetical protein n=1 Tax=Aliisedimentitalea sp. MJ-SS2 TaxID=3049795 RepID=UPI00290C7359|nr:hypothetical protein [Alisedimentitalea sp. MJ-SS2]MDU8926138.1 hypothetical protein [Alisedimentitalea sp. MJ-SS2]